MNDEDALLRAAVVAWNAGRWQAAHEGFEELWRAASLGRSAHGGHSGDAHEADARAEAALLAGDPRPELWRALAQAAAVGVLKRQGRANGARAVASKAAARLRALRDEHGPVIARVDVDLAAANLAQCVEDAGRLGALRLFD
ncbi:MAG: hypothetical protein RL112_2599 [Planctomycetota bacterium]